MSDYKIGKVIGVNGDLIEIILDDKQDDFGVPENMLINIKTVNGPESILIGQPGTFLKIQILNGMLLCMVADIKMKEINSLNNEDDIIMPLPQRILTLVPFGTINENGNFEKGTDVLPTVNSSVYAVSNMTINAIYSSYSDGNFNLGKLSLMPQQDALINLDAFLYSPCKSNSTTVDFSNSAIFCRKEATVQDFPLPVCPKIAPCKHKKASKFIRASC